MADQFKNWTSGKILFVSLAAILCILLLVAWESLVIMENWWSTKEEYGYAYIIPPVMLFFVWQRRYKFIHHRFRFSHYFRDSKKI